MRSRRANSYFERHTLLHSRNIVMYSYSLDSLLWYHYLRDNDIQYLIYFYMTQARIRRSCDH